MSIRRKRRRLLRRHRRPGASAHRAFDPRQVGSLECDAWIAYYRREWISFLRSAVALTRHTFGLPWPQTLQGAWLVLRANQLWAPLPNNDPEGARRAMERFYAMVARRYGETYDPARAAELEVEWWRVHRTHQRGKENAGIGPGEGDGAILPEERPLVEALAALYAYAYGVGNEDVRVAAEQRALAMRYSDEWVREGCLLESHLIPQERAALVRSYAGLLAGVYRP